MKLQNQLFNTPLKLTSILYKPQDYSLQLLICSKSPSIYFLFLFPLAMKLTRSKWWISHVGISHCYSKTKTQRTKLYYTTTKSIKFYPNSSIKNPTTKIHQQPNPNNLFTNYNINQLTSNCIFYSVQTPRKNDSFTWNTKFSWFLPHLKKTHLELWAQKHNQQTHIIKELRTLT